MEEIISKVILAVDQWIDIPGILNPSDRSSICSKRREWVYIAIADTIDTGPASFRRNGRNKLTTSNAYSGGKICAYINNSHVLSLNQVNIGVIHWNC